MDNKGMKEKLEEAKKIYFLADFRNYMRHMQGFTDEDFSSAMPKTKDYIMRSKQTEPFEMFEGVMHFLQSNWAKQSFPVHADWHHYIVPGVIMKSLQNLGYNISNRDIEEAMTRGEYFMGGSCGFAGTCGGAYSVGIVLSLIKRTTPLHVDERSRIMDEVARTLMEIAKYPKRCCKRSSYIAIQRTEQYLRTNGYDKLPYDDIKCFWSSQNKMCMGIKCPYFKNSKNNGRR